MIKACYEKNFMQEVQQLLNDAENKAELCLKISSACGIALDYSDDYPSLLCQALSQYSNTSRSVLEFRNCSLSCLDEKGTSSCEKSCEFGAITSSKSKGCITVDKEKCIQCGFCIEACSENCINYKSDLIPMIYFLTNKG